MRRFLLSLFTLIGSLVSIASPKVMAQTESKTAVRSGVRTEVLDESKDSGTSPKVGILLSGGGALGFAHIGVLQALEEAGISPDYVAGASMGALVGAFYCYGYSPEFIYDMVLDERLNEVTKLVSLTGAKVKGLSIFSNKRVRELLHKYFTTNNFDDLQKEMTVIVSNLSDSRTEHYSAGNNLQEYLLASMAIPAVFEPVVIDSKYYIDGGNFNHFPSYVLRYKVDILIGVDVMPRKKEVSLGGVMDVITSYMHSQAIINSKEGRSECDFLVDIHSIDKYSMSDFGKFKEIYQEGYDTMKAYIESHPEMVKRCATR